MFYITKKDSETGKKLAVFEKQLADAYIDQKKIAKEIGAIQWRNAYWVARGGFSSVCFEENAVVDKRIWKNVNKSSDEWMPRLNTP